ncbi:MULTISPECIES: hypothetical protein [unclassified Streptomyces]|uniref:hypothetical protein n=1 Tax=unclassified Streptomyces TaxID=2593676 RepID=UPI00234BDA5D|nr:hypothetical protein [Streptomyces sp. M92]WCN05346.1 hypothetical protein M6G08_26515 [Streptomyces sp. M92]
MRALAARSGIETIAQHLAGDTVLRETTGVRRRTGNLADTPSRRFATGAQSVADALAAALPTGPLRPDTPVTGVPSTGRASTYSARQAPSMPSTSSWPILPPWPWHASTSATPSPPTS